MDRSGLLGDSAGLPVGHSLGPAVGLLDGASDGESDGSTIDRGNHQCDWKTAESKNFTV